jgi:hypothetical protein
MITPRIGEKHLTIDTGTASLIRLRAPNKGVTSAFCSSVGTGGVGGMIVRAWLYGKLASISVDVHSSTPMAKLLCRPASTLTSLLVI